MRATKDAPLFVFWGGAPGTLRGGPPVQPHAGPIADRPHGEIDLVPLRLLALEHAAVEAVAHEAPQHVVLKRVRIVPVGATEQVMRHVGGEPADDEAGAENAAVIEDVA